MGDIVKKTALKEIQALKFRSHKRRKVEKLLKWYEHQVEVCEDWLVMDDWKRSHGE